MSTKPNQHATAAKLFFDCGHAELKPLNAIEYRHVSVSGPCTGCRLGSGTQVIDLLNLLSKHCRCGCKLNWQMNDGIPERADCRCGMRYYAGAPLITIKVEGVEGD